MIAKELIDALSKLPPDAKVLINDELGWYELDAEKVEAKEGFIIWRDRDGGGRYSYTHWSDCPVDFVQPDPSGRLPDYVAKTLSKETVILLG